MSIELYQSHSETEIYRIVHETDVSEIETRMSEVREVSLDIYHTKDHRVRVCEALVSNTSVEQLYLDSGFQKGEGYLIANILHHNTTLTSLFSNQNTLDSQDAFLIAEALKVNTALKHLILNKNLIQSDGRSAIIESLKVNTTLKTLDIPDYYGIGTDDGEQLAEMLLTNNTLSALHMIFGTPDQSQLIPMFQSLNSNTSLTSLYLGRCTTNFRRCVPFLVDLEPTMNLVELQLENCTIKDVDASSLAKIVRYNTTLTTLGLPKSRISLDGLIAIADAAKFNTTLINLDFSIESIDGEIMKKFDGISELLSTNTTLETLILPRSYPNESERNLITGALRKNEHITHLIFGDYRYRNYEIELLTDRNRQNRKMKRTSLLDLLWFRC